MNTYIVAFTPDVGGVKTASIIADRVEFPRASDPDGTHIKFFAGNELVGSVNPEYVYMMKKAPSGTDAGAAARDGQEDNPRTRPGR